VYIHVCVYSYKVICTYIYTYIYISKQILYIVKSPIPQGWDSDWISQWGSRIATHCNTLQHTTTRLEVIDTPVPVLSMRVAAFPKRLQHAATHYNTLQHVAVTWIRPGLPVLSILLAVFTVSPKSWKRARWPRITPAVTGPEWNPTRNCIFFSRAGVTYTHICVYSGYMYMGWLRLVGSIKL